MELITFHFVKKLACTAITKKEVWNVSGMLVKKISPNMGPGTFETSSIKGFYIFYKCRNLIFILFLEFEFFSFLLCRLDQ